MNKAGNRLVRTLVGVVVFGAAAMSAASNEGIARQGSNQAVMNKAGELGVPFVANAGQIANADVLFSAHTFYGTVSVAKDGGIVYALPRHDQPADGFDAISRAGRGVQRGRGIPDGLLVLRERAIGGQSCLPIGVDKSGIAVNSFAGSGRENWRTDIPAYQSVSLGQVYEGIELHLKAYGKNVEKIFVAAPGASPNDICMAIDGAECLDINEAGDLVVGTRFGEVAFRAPVAYQEIAGKRMPVEVAYWTDGAQYGFDVGAFDGASALVIDPLLASTYVGGMSDEESLAIAIDSLGNVYIAGDTCSSDYPVTPGVYDPIYTWGDDIFITRLNTNLSALVASTFLGGAYHEQCNAIALDSSNNVYIAGWKYGSDSRDAYVAKLNSDLNTLIASSQFGGSGDDKPFAIAVDASRNVFLAGWTESGNFPVTPGAYDTSYNGGGDVFVAMLNPEMSGLVACTYLGGTVEDIANTLVLDAATNIYVAGWTSSSNYPSTPVAYDAVFNGISDVFVSKLNPDMTGLLASSFIGGVLDEYARAMAKDASGNIFVTGWTRSDDFPVTAGAFDAIHNGYYDVFVSKLSAGLDVLAASTFLGTDGEEYGHAMVVAADGSVYVTGYTCSSNFPVTAGAYDTQHNGSAWESDVFVSRLSSGLDVMMASTFIGGSRPDYANGVTLDAAGNVNVTGLTLSSNYPVTSNAYDVSYHGNGRFDVFVSRLDPDLSSGRAVFNDYNGDGRSDLAVFDNNGGFWYVQSASGETVVWQEQWGWSGAVPVPGDYDGDGRYDMAVFDANNGNWYVRSLTGDVILWAFQWGWPGAEPVCGDFDSDGHSDLALFDRNTGKWYIWSPAFSHVILWEYAWGGATSDTVAGDYDGDARSDLAVFDQGAWYISSVAGGTIMWQQSWGGAGMTTVPGDYDRDGRDDLAVFDGTTGNWYIRSVAGTIILWQHPWGWAGVTPVSGDFDGDGRADLAVFDGSTGYWYIAKVDGTILVWQRPWGWSGAWPVGGR